MGCMYLTKRKVYYWSRNGSTSVCVSHPHTFMVALTLYFVCELGVLRVRGYPAAEADPSAEAARESYNHLRVQQGRVYFRVFHVASTGVVHGSRPSSFCYCDMSMISRCHLRAQSAPTVLYALFMNSLFSSMSLCDACVSAMRGGHGRRRERQIGAHCFDLDHDMDDVAPA
jgi:hypothetical protein